MKIVIDARMIGWTGIGRYTRALLDHLQEIDHDNHYLVIMVKRDFDSWEPTAGNFHKVLVDIEPYTLGEQIKLPFKLLALRPSLVHFTHFALPLLYPGRFVATIHDLTLLDFKNYRGGGLHKLKYELRYQAMRALLWVATRRAKRILTPSKASAERLEHFFPAAGPKTTVTYEAAAPAINGPTEAVPGITKPFLLYVGNYYPYKNVPVLIEAVEMVRQNHSDIQLALPGGNWRNESFVKAVQQQSGASQKDWLAFPGYVSDAQLAWLYQNTELFVFPSLSEGFGLPGLEAMLNGAPVAAARASCLPEIYGEAAEYFDPKDPTAIAEVINGLLASPERLAKLRQLGRERLKQFSWQRMAEETLAVYQKALP